MAHSSLFGLSGEMRCPPLSASWVIYNHLLPVINFSLGKDKGHSLALDESIYEIQREKLKKIEAR
jgi:hypothetical protein